MQIPDEFEVERILRSIPIRATDEPLPVDELYSRIAEALRLANIDAFYDGRGIHFGADGVSEEDQPLSDVIETVMRRRFGQSEVE